ncbi:hypothetical protein LIER_32640 [Lithospermum erythrorhizon]|uniref:Transmembrane protein n=1 Tax=Lithospermum erythrorhizon TaxID=34254 RepID=A0AAV3RYB2_LITER
MSLSSSSPLQPFQESPTSATSQEPPHSSSSGSYSQVFIVLAIICVVSIVGCVVGRVCCKDGESRANKNQGGSKKKGKRGKGNHGVQPKDVDIEFGLENKLKPIPSAKIAAGDGINRGFQAPPGGWNGEVKGIKGPPGGHMEFKNGPGPIPYTPGNMEFKRGPGPMPYN